LEGSGSGLMEVLSQHLSGLAEEYHKKPQSASVLAETRTKLFLNTCLELYYHINLLSKEMLCHNWHVSTSCLPSIITIPLCRMITLFYYHHLHGEDIKRNFEPIYVKNFLFLKFQFTYEIWYYTMGWG
jgi:hypothetical protein